VHALRLESGGRIRVRITAVETVPVACADADVLDHSGMESVPVSRQRVMLEIRPPFEFDLDALCLRRPNPKLDSSGYDYGSYRRIFVRLHERRASNSGFVGGHRVPCGRFAPTACRRRRRCPTASAPTTQSEMP